MKLQVKSTNRETQLQRETTALRVIAQFGLSLAKSRMLCFLDDEDPAILKDTFGKANRAIYAAVRDSTPLEIWPDYVIDHILVDDGEHFVYQRVVDELFY